MNANELHLYIQRMAIKVLVSVFGFVVITVLPAVAISVYTITSSIDEMATATAINEHKLQEICNNVAELSEKSVNLNRRVNYIFTRLNVEQLVKGKTPGNENRAVQ